MSEIVGFIQQRLDLNGCTIEENDKEVIVHTPDIHVSTAIIHLSDEKEYERLALLLNRRVLIQKTKLIDNNSIVVFIKIDELHI